MGHSEKDVILRGFSLSRFVTRACVALVLLAAIQVRADFIHPVTGTQGLVTAAAKIKSTIDSGTHVVRISAYARVGQFRLVEPPAKVQTLIFERDSLQQSDSVLRVSGDTALLEIKNMRSGTVILRGLAFHLASPESRLIAGAEPGRENLHLIIDSCFIFGESNASSFLTWLGTSGSNIDIRRSFFVFGTGDGRVARTILTSTSLTLANNLFHFNGQLSATVLTGGKADFRSNTVHRTQLRLNSDAFQGAIYVLSRNFIGHRPAQDAFGTADPYFLWATNFLPGDSYARSNVILRSWTGFDHPGGSPRTFAADTSNKVRDTITVKPVTELWDWYGPNGTIDSTGHAFGLDRRTEPYNIFPGAVSSPFAFEGNPGSVHFKPAFFPRRFAAVRTSMPIPAADDSVRFHTPNLGALRFGSFQVDSLRFNMATVYGRAQLFSNDTAFQFRPQRIVSAAPSQPHVFANDIPQARYFFIGFKGNTPKGIRISPDRSSSDLGVGDTLSFGKVDSAGFTKILEEARQEYPDSLRSLGRSFYVQTTAAVSDSLVFGSTEGVKPFWSDQVYWWRPRDALLHKALPAENGRFVATAAATQTFSAYLTEKLSVKRGGTTLFPLARGGQVEATSVAGYQLRIDSLYIPDSLRFGQASRGYSLVFSGRQAGDSLFLRLPGGPDTEVFRVDGNPFPAVPASVDPLGFHTVPIAPGDSNVRLFSGIRFNVIANQVFTDTLGGVRISGLKSSRSGKISFLPFDESLLLRGIGTQDTLPSNARLLGACGIRSLSLVLAEPWSATFPVSRAGDSTRIAAYAWDGLKWRVLPTPLIGPGATLTPTVTGLWATDQAVAVFELLKPASEYVGTESVEGVRTLSIRVFDKNDVHKLITGFSLHVLHVNMLGDVESLKLGPATVGQTLTQDLTIYNGLFMYAVIYHTAVGDYLPAYVPITKFSWNAAGMSVGGAPVKAGQQWHLLGSPYQSSLGKALSERGLADPNAKDTMDVLSLKTVNDSAVFETVANDKTMNLNSGDAFLFSSAQHQEHLVDTTATFVVSKEHPLGPHTGWRFVSPPYPINFPTSAVRSSHPEMGRFLELKMDPLSPPIAGKVREYTWVTADRLKPFTGYAYRFAPDEVLTFNPWYGFAPVPVPKRGDNLPPLGSVQVKLEVEGRTRSMQLLGGGGIREMPYLQAPGGGLEMRVGGKGGWFVKKVGDLLGIDESVVIRSPASARGRLELGLKGLPAQRKDWRARLIHLASGQVIDLSAGFALSPGEQEYRLVAGTEAFLSERITAFKSGLPPGLILSQNYPNPFRAHTRINLEWPALTGKAANGGRKAMLEVFDARGRRVHSLDLGEIRAGMQVVTLDGSRWEPGLYTYRLTVDQAGSRARLQKRMLVSP